jgi:RNA polymerase sigma-70 factor (ECF subfamily)
MTDRDLLELLRKDPDKGIKSVVLQYSAYVMKIAYIKLNSVCTAEDMEEAVSDIFLKFFNTGIKSGFAFESVRGSLSLIAGRHCVDVFRSRVKKEKDIPLYEVIEFIADESIIKEDTSRTLVMAIKSLGEPDSTIFMRKYFLGQKSKDIAADLDLKPNTVDKKISRGLKKLKEILMKEGEE